MRSRVRTHYLLVWMALLLIGSTLLIHAISYAALYRTLAVAEHAVQLSKLHDIFVWHVGLVVALLLLVLIIFALVLYRDQRRLSKLAARDPLTYSLNQQTFDVVFKLFLYRAMRDHSPICAQC